MRRILSATDLLLFMALAALGCWLVWHRPTGMREDSASVLAGALFGAAALLLGNWINRWNEARREAVELTERKTKLTTVVTARLVNVATSLMNSKQLADAALESASEVPASELLGPFPEIPSIVRDLGADLWLFDERTIDALVTLESVMQGTRRDLEQRADRGLSVPAIFGVRQVLQGIGHNMEILAQCFERVAPTRRFEMDSRPAELASAILRREAQLPRRL